MLVIQQKKKQKRKIIFVMNAYVDSSNEPITVGIFVITIQATDPFYVTSATGLLLIELICNDTLPCSI